MEEYYVYVYIDPRNFEEFYYGKGKGNRKKSHLDDDSDTEKVRRINDIKSEGLDPIIRVVAKDLTEEQAFLVEKTLIWKLGKTLTNISSGHFADKFRPHDQLHRELSGFDFKNDIYYVNVGEGSHRNWDECLKYGFLSAGQGKKYSDPIRTLEVGDIVVAYLKGKGYVGVGKVEKRAIRVNDFKIEDKSLKEYNLNSNIFENSDNDKSEYILELEWLKTFERSESKWQRGLFSSQLVKSSLKNQSETIEFIEKEFDIKFKDYLN